ncbi:MADF domain [Cinara cedri]|uniref:MADF domain n=1 Tax=Cinara cedri TaxID=506608 RepID=A0A5E4MNW5_9HEMI|nr:MADF domain [Cinara cedri]
MASEQEENVTFVQHTESHPCLYDITSSNYTRQDIKEKAWNDISKKTNNSNIPREPRSP